MTRVEILRRIDHKVYPLRVCRTKHLCAICGRPITRLQDYYDGGPRRRVHVYHNRRKEKGLDWTCRSLPATRNRYRVRWKDKS